LEEFRFLIWWSVIPDSFLLCLLVELHVRVNVTEEIHLFGQDVGSFFFFGITVIAYFCISG
jgi:hypothetical protein